MKTSLHTPNTPPGTDPASNPISRREFIGSGVTAGFALATLPIAAWAITTPTDGITAGEISVPTADGPMPGYWAMPKGAGPFPTILVVHEIFGVHEYIQDVCRRLAKEGYLAVCPYLYFRQGDVTRLKEIQEIRSRVVSKVSQPKVMSDLDATLEWLKKGKKADLARAGITGFCWGGTVTWMYSAHQPRIKAGVAWYGKLVGETSELQPSLPIDTPKQLKCPVLGLYGGKDSGIPLDTVERMRGALEQAKKAGNKAAAASEIAVYPEAQHGFHADYRPSYDEKAAADAWVKLLSWFRRHGVAPRAGAKSRKA